MRELALNETFDGLIAWDSFFHLTQQDQQKMFPIFDRLSHPGSALMFTSGTDNGIAMGQFEGEPLFHASLAPDEYRALLSAHGFCGGRDGDGRSALHRAHHLGWRKKEANHRERFYAIQPG